MGTVFFPTPMLFFTVASFKEYSWLKGFLRSLSLELFRWKKEERYVKSHCIVSHVNEKLQSIEDEAVGNRVDSGTNSSLPFLPARWTWTDDFTFPCRYLPESKKEHSNVPCLLVLRRRSEDFMKCISTWRSTKWPSNLRMHLTLASHCASGFQAIYSILPTIMNPRDRKLVAAPKCPSDSDTAVKSTEVRLPGLKSYLRDILINRFPSSWVWCLRLYVGIKDRKDYTKCKDYTKIHIKHIEYCLACCCTLVKCQLLSLLLFLLLIISLREISITAGLMLPHSISSHWMQSLKNAQKFTGKDIKMINENKVEGTYHILIFLWINF